MRKTIRNDVQKLGYSRRKSDQILDIVIESMKKGLVKDGELSLPVGDLIVKESPKPNRMWRLDKIVTQYKNSKRIKFKPRKDLDLDE